MSKPNKQRVKKVKVWSVLSLNSNENEIFGYSVLFKSEDKARKYSQITGGQIAGEINLIYEYLPKRANNKK